MRTKATLIFFLFLFGVIIIGCDNRKSENFQKVTNNNTVTQTQNIQSVESTGRTKEQKEAWKKATAPSGYDYSKYNKPLP